MVRPSEQRLSAAIKSLAKLRASERQPSNKQYLAAYHSLKQAAKVAARAAVRRARRAIKSDYALAAH